MSNLKNNPYWQMTVSGCEIPLTFNDKLWRDAVDEGVKRVSAARIEFIKNPSIFNYNEISIHVEILETMAMYLNAFVQVTGGVSEKKWKEAKFYIGEKIQIEAEKTLPAVISFIDELSSNGSAKDVAWAAREKAVCYQAFNPAGANIDKLESDLSAREKNNTNVFFKEWPESTGGGDFKKSLTADGGWFFVNPGNFNASTIMSAHANEDVRKEIWAGIQESIISDKEIQSFIDVRDAGAKASGLNSYLDISKLLTRGINGNKASGYISSKLCENKKIFNDAENSIIARGAKKLKGESVDDSLPWNSEHLKWLGAEGCRSIDIGVLPMRRVATYVIPELLKLGGWSVVGKPEKNGRGARAIYKYRLTDGKRPALFYFSGRRRLFLRESDFYLGECSAFRQRRQINNRRAVTPVVVVNLDLNLDKNCLDELVQLQYIAHEVGHALHFLEFPGTESFELHKTPAGVAEVPSLMMEEIVKDPNLLMKWANPNGPAKGRTHRYWASIVNDVKNDENIVHLFNRAEKCIFDTLSQGKKAKQFPELRDNIRAKLGMSEVIDGDRGYAALFDCNVIHAGNDYAYIVGESVAKTLIKTDGYQKAVTRLMSVLAKSSDINFSSIWYNQYGCGVSDTFKIGFDLLVKEKVAITKNMLKKYK